MAVSLSVAAGEVVALCLKCRPCVETRSDNEESMAITMTDAAAQHVSRYLENRGQGTGIRVAVRTTGCSGMGYVLEFADESNPEDEVFEAAGIKVIVDPKSLVYLDGTELDFVREGLNEGFKFNNPNARSECGCGESFSV